MGIETMSGAVGRRGLIAGAVVAGLGALIATEAHARNSITASAAAPPLSADAKLQHLLRRAGFGASPAELATYQPLGWNGAIDRLVNFESVDNSALDARLSGLGLDLTKKADLQRWW